MGFVAEHSRRAWLFPQEDGVGFRGDESGYVHMAAALAIRMSWSISRLRKIGVSDPWGRVLAVWSNAGVFTRS